LRGGTGINIDTGRTSATDSYMNYLAMGRYLTSKDAAVFKQPMAHIAVATTSDVLCRKGHISNVYVAPGIRFGLYNNRWPPFRFPSPDPNRAFQPNFAISCIY
jgi:hypothetical protein